MIARFVFGSIAILGLGASVSAQEPTSPNDGGDSKQSVTCLEFVEALGAAGSSSPEVAIARAEAAAAEARAGIERGTGRPQLSAYARAAEGDVGLVDGRTNTQTGLVVSQRLFDFGQGRFRLQAVEAEAEADEFGLSEAQRQIKARTGYTYLSVLENRELFEAARERDARYRVLALGVERRLEAGLITIAEASSIKAESASAAAQSVEQSISLEGQEVELASLTGTLRPACTNAEKISAVLLSAVQGIAQDPQAQVDELPELKAADARVAAATAKFEVARRIRRPTISVEGVAAYQYDSLFDEWQTATRVGLDVTIPIYGGGAYGGEREEASASIAAAKGERDRLVRDYQRDLRRSRQRARAFVELAQARTNEVEAQRAEVDAVRRQFEARVRPYQDYERAEAALALAEVASIEARYDALREQLTLATLTNTLPE